MQRLQYKELTDKSVLNTAAVMLGKTGRLPVLMQREVAIRLCRLLCTDPYENAKFEAIVREALKKPSAPKQKQLSTDS
jgi:hypothetical protein